MSKGIALSTLLLAWTWGCAYHDTRERRIPNRLTIPAALATMAWAVATGHVWLTISIWTLLEAMFSGGLIGGGDAKMLMALLPLSLGGVSAVAMVAAGAVMGLAVLKLPQARHGGRLNGGLLAALFVSAYFVVEAATLLSNRFL